MFPVPNCTSMAGSMSEPRRPVLAASIAVFRQGKVLLAQRAKAPAVGLYSLPGGRLELGEGVENCALRELREEVGVCAEILGYIDRVEHIERGEDGMAITHAVILAFAGAWLSGEPVPSNEVSDILWVDPLAPGELPMTRGLPAILTRAAEILARSEILARTVKITRERGP
jgi:8-oxo-dGTP diphosphatase